MKDLLGGVDRVRLERRFGPRVRTWLDGLPEVIDILAAQWRLELEALIPAGANSVVLTGTALEQGPIVLKLTPDPAIADQEAIALRAWSGLPTTVGLLDSDAARGALLLDAVPAAVQLSEDPAGWTLRDVAPLLVDLRRPLPSGPPKGLPTLAERIELVFDLAQGRRAAATPDGQRLITASRLERDRGRARALAASGPITLVHGDLHPGNVLRGWGGSPDGLGGPDGCRLVAIDPRPCLGDPDTDAVDWVLAGVTSEAQVGGRIAELADLVPGVDPERLDAWCLAFAGVVGLSALIRDGDDPVGRFLVD